jgi:hypothetical protein
MGKSEEGENCYHPRVEGKFLKKNAEVKLTPSVL